MVRSIFVSVLRDRSSMRSDELVADQQRRRHEIFRQPLSVALGQELEVLMASLSARALVEAVSFPLWRDELGSATMELLCPYHGSVRGLPPARATGRM